MVDTFYFPDATDAEFRCSGYSRIELPFCGGTIFTYGLITKDQGTEVEYLDIFGVRKVSRYSDKRDGYSLWDVSHKNLAVEVSLGLLCVDSSFTNVSVESLKGRILLPFEGVAARFQRL